MQRNWNPTRNYQKTWLVGHETCRLPFGRDVRPLQNKGLELYQHCPYHELKLRYGYQLVRLAHYMRNKNNEAIRMYNLYVKPLKQEHYIYYAALNKQPAPSTT